MSLVRWTGGQTQGHELATHTHTLEHLNTVNIRVLCVYCVYTVCVLCVLTCCVPFADGGVQYPVGPKVPHEVSV